MCMRSHQHTAWFSPRACFSWNLDSHAHKHFCYHLLCRRIHFIFIQWTCVCVCVWTGKRFEKLLCAKWQKKNAEFFGRNVWIWYEVKESWKHIENERWTVCLLFALAYGIAIKSIKVFHEKIHQSIMFHVVVLFSSRIFCHFVYDIYNSLLVGWCILSCFCGSSPRFHVHITLNGKIHMITITQTRVSCNCIYMIWCAYMNDRSNGKTLVREAQTTRTHTFTHVHMATTFNFIISTELICRNEGDWWKRWMKSNFKRKLSFCQWVNSNGLTVKHRDQRWKWMK